MADSPLIAFYRGSGRDAADRSLAEILAWDDERLERVHDYIQWLFPLDAPSAFNPLAPVLTPADIAAFRRDPQLRERLRDSLLRMIRFYGLACDDARAVRIEPSARFGARASNWLTPGNHNHLRLTRILRSLSLLGLEAHARALLHCLEAIAADYPGAIEAKTLDYWRRAVG